MSGAADALDRRDAVDMAAAAIMVGLTFSWGLNYVAAKISYAGYDPVFLSIARSVIGGLCVFLWCRWRGVALFRRDGTLLAGIAVGVLFGIEFLCLYVGLEHTTVARNTLLVNTMPFWMLLGAISCSASRSACANPLAFCLPLPASPQSSPTSSAAAGTCCSAIC